MAVPGQAFHFGAFVLHPSSRLLLEDGQPVRLGARALDLLIALVERRGEVIPKEMLFRQVWPNTVVEETSLRVHIAALRKALGGPNARYIANIPGKGYAFTGRLDAPGPAAAAAALPRNGPRHNLPIRLTRMVGRGAATADLAAVLRTQRFVTITGEGGVGKTTLALAIAENALAEYGDGVAFVDLATCTAPALLVSTLGRALGLALPAHAPVDALAEALRDRHFLFVVDNCEHLLAPAAAVVGTLLGAWPQLRILATSREALRADGEQVHRLQTLPVPPPDLQPGAEAALRYESIQLLVERVAAANDGFVLSDGDAPHAAELCRRLDGVPLAIELAAARVSFFGLQGLVARLRDRLVILTSGHRTVMPRHRTLRALYDWSFDLLEPEAQQAYARLAVFPASFPLDAALALMPCAERSSALPLFLDLVAKSLVTVDLQGQDRRYRLLDTARLYALEKLAGQDERAEARRQHAAWLLQALRQANSAWEHASRRRWAAQHAPLAEDIGSLLDGLHRDADSAVLQAELVDAAYLLFQELSQLEVLRPPIAEALERLQAQGPHPQRARRLLVLGGQAMSHCRPRPADAAGWFAQTQAALAAADAAPDLLYVATVLHMQHAEYKPMLRMAERLELAGEYAGDRESVLTGRRFQAVAHHHLGHFQLSRALGEQALLQPTPRLRSSMPFDNIDRSVPLGITFARAAWLEGDAVEAEQLLERVGEQVTHEVERFQCQFLALSAIPICLWSGETERAAKYLTELRRLTALPHLGDFWDAWADAFASILEQRRPEADGQACKLLDMVAATSPLFESALALDRARAGLAGWCAPEVLRLQGERLRDSAPAEAQALFDKALLLAREQGAARWELRAAISAWRLALARGTAPLDERRLRTPLARMRVHPTDPDVAQATALLGRAAQPAASLGQRAAG